MYEMPEEVSAALTDYTVALGVFCIVLAAYVIRIEIDKRRKKKEDNNVEKSKN